MRRSWLALAFVLAAAAGCSDRGGIPVAAAPGNASRLVTLSPHLAELVYAAGAGERLVGVSAYSNYPAAVTGLPVIGDAFQVDHEQLALLRPDLLLAWESGTPAHIVDELRARGYRVEVVRTSGIADVPVALRRIGELTGSEATAARAAEAFAGGMQALGDDWADAAPIRVFYQISTRPLYTVNGDHYVSELIALCGGENVFGELRDLAPLVSEEAVLDRNPEVLLAAGIAGETPFAAWSRWPSLAANRYRNHFLLPADEIGRATPRLLVAGRAMCEALQRGRDNRSAMVADVP